MEINNMNEIVWNLASTLWGIFLVLFLVVLVVFMSYIAYGLLKQVYTLIKPTPVGKEPKITTTELMDEAEREREFEYKIERYD